MRIKAKEQRLEFWSENGFSGGVIQSPFGNTKKLNIGIIRIFSHIDPSDLNS